MTPDRAADYYVDDEHPAALWATYDAAVARGEVVYTAPPALAKPLLLVDVDGVANALGGPYSGRPAPDGYVLHRLRDRSFTDAQGRAWVSGGLRLSLNPDHGRMLLAIADLVELTWCTAWREAANEHISPAIGLPELPVVPLPDGWQTVNENHWKIPGVEESACGRALAWFDDEFTVADDGWAAKRTAGGAPTLLVHIDPMDGLQQRDVDTVAGWAGRLGVPDPDEPCATEPARTHQ